MNSFYKKLLNNINTYIIVLDLNDNIIYKNNDIALILYEKNNNLKEINYNEKIYSVDYVKINEYNIQVYNDITEYKLEIKKLEKDYLTNLYNRYTILEKLKELKDTEYILVMCDIDFFKQINVQVIF